MDVAAILRRYDALYEQQSVWRSVWQEIANYQLPRKSDILTRRAVGQKQMSKVFDSTAIHANELLASSMQGALTSATIKWFRLKTRIDDLNDDPEISAWLGTCAEQMYLSLQQSNFNGEMQEVYLDLGAFGTGAMTMEENETTQKEFSGFLFHALPVGSYVIAENAAGTVDTLMLRLVMSARAAFGRWGPAIGERLTQIKETKPDEPVEILHAIYPRGTYGKTARKKPWASCFIYKEGKHEIHEGGFDEFPGLVPRWTKASGEVYGRGPGHTALPDVKTLNRAVELTLKAWAKAIDPPMKARNEGVIGTVKLTPGSINTVVNMDDLEALESKARFDVGQIKEERLQASIKDVYFNDLTSLPAKQYMTATEVERALELMQRKLGPTLGRLESELLNPLIVRGFGMMLRRGALPPPPKALLEMASQSGSDIDIEYEGPLARAQKASEVQAVERTIVQADAVAKLMPDALDVLDFDAMLIGVARQNGLPSKYVRSAQDVKALRDARAKAQQEAAAAAKQAQVGQTARDVAPLLKAAKPGGLAPEELEQMMQGTAPGAPQ